MGEVIVIILVRLALQNGIVNVGVGYGYPTANVGVLRLKGGKINRVINIKNFA